MVAAVAVTLLAGCGGASTQASTGEALSPSPTVDASPEPSQPPTPTPTPTKDPRLFAIGEPVEFAQMVLTLNSFEVLQQIPTTDGVPMTAAAGEQLVLFHTHFVNKSTETVDLSCSGATSAFIEVLDTAKNKMAAVFDTYRIPGNPKCNYELLPGQEHDWNFAFRGIAGSTPMALTITDTRTYKDFVAVNLTNGPLAISAS